MTLNLSHTDLRNFYLPANGLANRKNFIPDFEKSIQEKIQLSYEKIAQLNENLRTAEILAENLEPLYSICTQSIYLTDLSMRIQKCQELTGEKLKTLQTEKTNFEKSCVSFLKQAKQSVEESSSIKQLKCKKESLHSLDSIKRYQAMTEETLKKIDTELKKSISEKFLKETTEKIQSLLLSYSLQLLQIAKDEEIVTKSLLTAFSRSSNKWVKFHCNDSSRYEDLTPIKSQEINKLIQENPQNLTEILTSNNIGLVDPSTKKIFRLFKTP